MGERMRVGQCCKLISSRLSQPGLGKAQRNTPKTAQALKISIVLVILDVDAFSTGNNQRPLFFMGCEIGIGMQCVSDVLFLSFANRFVHGGLDGAGQDVMLASGEFVT